MGCLVARVHARTGGSAVLLTAPNWEAVDSLFSHDRQAVVLATPALQPAPGRCELPTILLLEHEPEAAPSAVSDWLVRDQLNADTLRRSLRHVRERGCWSPPCSALPSRTR